VDEQTAQVLKTEVSDGIIAPGNPVFIPAALALTTPDFDESALAILKQKKNGAYIVIKVSNNPH
jgi:AICAR transformylase/IMP cyclohydrolase PurH